ncbi:hypothetical protein [Streptomyces sp. NPDC091383]|uniref:hypothetical protein n=1 Tax=Streptomyces sp. NPDC091383 TaxID=3365996 RepID=UPI00382845B4
MNDLRTAPVVGGDLPKRWRPVRDAVVATVITRTPPEFRRRGFGTVIYGNALDRARARGAGVVETRVRAADGDGPRFAVRRGFEEVERHMPDGERDEWVDLRLLGTGAGD